MSKKNKPNSSAGTTANPAPQPTAPPAKSPAPAGAKGKSTAGPAPSAPAAETSDDHDASVMTELLTALDSGSGSPATDETPDANDVTPAGPEATGEEAGAAEASGETDHLESNSDSNSDTDQDGSENPDPNSETNPETEAAEGGAGHDGDDDADDDEGASGKWPKSYLRRINKLTAKIERLEEQANEAETLREENERLKSQTPETGAASNLPVTADEQTLAGKIAKLEQTLDFIEANPDGAELDGKQWTPAQLRAARRETERALRDAEDDLRESRRERQQRAAHVEQTLATRHPWMKDRKHPATARVEAVLRRYPALGQIPEARAWLADGLAYQALLEHQARTKGNGNGNGNGTAPNGQAVNGNGHGSRPAPPAPRPSGQRGPGKPGAAPLPVNGQRASLKAKEQKFNETGDLEAGKELLVNLLGD